MDRFRNSLFTVIGLVIFAFTLAVAADMGYAAPGATTSNVNVVNTAINPVPVSVVNDGKQPFQMYVPVTVPANNTSGFTNFSVPAGKRLVIEFVSGNNTLFPGQKLRDAHVLTWLGGGFVRHYLVVHHGEPYGGTGGNEEFVISQPLKAYADGGTNTVQVFFSREVAPGGNTPRTAWC